MCGSSPRVWGALRHQKIPILRIRLIPTCVGSTTPGVTRVRCAAAHPHVCGEHFPNTDLLSIVSGSSPRVWGALDVRDARRPGVRLIPTCVGSTSRTSAALPRNTAHPHVCGEHLSCFKNTNPVHGSSPRVWGAPSTRKTHSIQSRLIPTCVGSTGWTHPNHRTPTAHPHVCGEHAHTPSRNHPQTGSSPRVWGAHEQLLHEYSEHRLIPTCVGSTPRCPTPSGWCPAHPHVCGEHPEQEREENLPLGSSPRVWGALSGETPGNSPGRLIPTCVGSTHAVWAVMPMAAAHPHVCGEHSAIISQLPTSLGSSPRVWGALRFP